MKPYYDEAGISIYHGDCREVVPTLGFVDLMVTDPPYGVGYQSNRSNRFHGNPVITGDDASSDVEEGIRLAMKRLGEGSHFYIFGPLDVSEWTFGATAELIWDKGKLGLGDLSLPWGTSHERITFGVWAPRGSQTGAGSLSARKRRGSVIRVPSGNIGEGARYHPTAKPVLLIRQLIESSSMIGDTVLDPFMGAGSTLVAARIEGRNAIGIEIEERYCEVAVQRLAQGVLAL